MSDYHTYRVVAPLVSAFADADAFVAAAAERCVYFDLTSGPIATSTGFPSFGSGTSCEAFFSAWGLDVSGGILSLGVFATNLERQPDVDEVDEAGRPVIGTRLERLLAFLAEVTTGEVGEIQGAYSTEGWGFEVHAHPVIRCGDGHLRVARTPITHSDDGCWYKAEEAPEIVIPKVLPIDLVSAGYRGAMLDLDLARLRERFTPLATTS
jgi:hypothetical protein